MITGPGIWQRVGPFTVGLWILIAGYVLGLLMGIIVTTAFCIR